MKTLNKRFLCAVLFLLFSFRVLEQMTPQPADVFKSSCWWMLGKHCVSLMAQLFSGGMSSFINHQPSSLCSLIVSDNVSLETHADPLFRSCCFFLAHWCSLLQAAVMEPRQSPLHTREPKHCDHSQTFSSCRSLRWACVCYKNARPEESVWYYWD